MKPTLRATGHGESAAPLGGRRRVSRDALRTFTKRLQFWAHLGDHGQVLFALVPVEGLLERLRRLVGATGGVEHFGEVAERVPLKGERVRALGDRHCLSSERFRLRVLAA
jgi:hypothetical protein